MERLTVGVGGAGVTVLRGYKIISHFIAFVKLNLQGFLIGRSIR
jgi:hypothetical protein